MTRSRPNVIQRLTAELQQQGRLDAPANTGSNGNRQTIETATHRRTPWTTPQT